MDSKLKVTCALHIMQDNSGDVDKYAVEAQAILKVAPAQPVAACLQSASDHAPICKQAARNEVTNMINAKKSAKQAELDAQYNEAKAKITKEVPTSNADMPKCMAAGCSRCVAWLLQVEASIAALEKESQAMLKKLDAQVSHDCGITCSNWPACILCPPLLPGGQGVQRGAQSCAACWHQDLSAVQAAAAEGIYAGVAQCC